MQFPDFFIIGAPKCGTTALYNYLAGHPGIFMGYPKEPNYYCEDLVSIRRTPTLEQYEKVFAGAQTGVLRGEASPWYLYSKSAVRLILADNPAAKFIVCLRNPVDMFLSYQYQLQFNLIGELSNPENAWRNQGAWPAGPAVNASQGRPDFGGICRLGEQSRRLLQTVDRSRVLFVFFDDMVRDMRGVYEEILRFIGTPSNGRTEFPVHNQRKAHRFPALTRILMRPPFPLNYIKRAVVALVRLRWKNPASIYDGVLSKPHTQSAVRIEFRDELTAYFSDDVALLESLTGRDLSAWRKLSDRPARISA